MDENEQQNPNTPILQSIETNGEHSLLEQHNTTEAVKNLEIPLEGVLQKMAQVAENTQPKDVQVVEIKGISVITIKGDKGDQGNIFDELTPEQKASIKGEQGEKGDPGEKGDSFVFEDFTPEEIDALRGPQGPIGPEGPKGADSTVAGPPGPKGADSRVPGPVGPQGPSGALITGAEIVAKHKALPEKERISYEDLTDLPNLEAIQRNNRESGDSGKSSKTYSISEMMDVSMQGIVAGQLLQWDGTRFIPYTPSSSGVTQVFGEVIGSAASAAFTLAHTPVVGSVRVYRGGAYQQGGAGKDYTISGASGTLASVLQTGEILLADYNY